MSTFNWAAALQYIAQMMPVAVVGLIGGIIAARYAFRGKKEEIAAKKDELSQIAMKDALEEWRQMSATLTGRLDKQQERIDSLEDELKSVEDRNYSALMYIRQLLRSINRGDPEPPEPPTNLIDLIPWKGKST